MNPRTSLVGAVRIIGVSNSGAFLAGDLKAFLPRSKALAVQREIPTYFGKEGAFEVYRAFTLPIPEPYSEDHVALEIQQTVPTIKVGGVSVYSVTNSSLFQIGSVELIRSENRLKHIRQLLRGRRPV